MTVYSGTWKGYDGSSSWNFRGGVDYGSPTQTATTWSLPVTATYMQKTSGGQCYGTGGWICGLALSTTTAGSTNSSKKYVTVPNYSYVVGYARNETSAKIYFTNSNTNYKVGSGGTITIAKGTTRQVVYPHVFAGRYTSGGDGVYNGSVDTYIGGSYTIPAITRTLTYNANGGTGQPSAQTGENGYGVTISSVKPTRPLYDFLGWSTSSTATAPTYASGSSITLNADTTLYAVWRLSFAPPVINNLRGLRVGSTTSSAIDNEGKVGYCDFDVTMPTPIKSGTSVKVKATFKINDSSTTYETTKTITQSGKVSIWSTANWLDTSESATIDIAITCTPAYEDTEQTYPMDSTYISAQIVCWDAYQKNNIASFAVGQMANTSASRFDVGVPMYVDGNPLADYIIEQGTDGVWHYEKKASGRFDIWCRNSVTAVITTPVVTGEYVSGSYLLGLPTFVKYIDYSNASFQAATGIPHSAEIASLSTTGLEIYFYSIGAYTFGGFVQVFIKGRWK